MAERNEIDLAKVAHIDSRIAELTAQIAELMLERSQLFRGLAKANANVRTGRKVHRAHEPALDPVNDAVLPVLESANRQRAARRRSGT
jgi:molecular chaperone GrpE (heat shock protein)